MTRLANRVVASASASVAVLALGLTLNGAFGFAYQVVLGRTLGPDGLGVIAPKLAFINLAIPVAGAGLPKYWLHAWAQPKADPSVVPQGSFALLAGGLVSGIAASVVGIAVVTEATIASLSLIALVPGITMIELVQSVEQSRMNYLRQATWIVVPNLSRLVAAVFVTGLSLSVMGAEIALGLAGAVLAMLGIGYLANQFRRARAVGRSRTVVMRETFPYATESLIFVIYMQVDIALLPLLGVGSSEVGNYAIAVGLLTAPYMLSAAVFQRYLTPKVHRWYVNSPSRYEAALGTSLRVAAIMAVVATAGLALTGPWLIDVTVGAEFAPAKGFLLFLLGAIPARLLADAAGTLMAVRVLMPHKVRLMAVAGCGNVVLNVALIPRYGVHGAIAATLAVEWFLAAAFISTARRRGRSRV